jgi:hypothetical protein
MKNMFTAVLMVFAMNAQANLVTYCEAEINGQGVGILYSADVIVFKMPLEQITNETFGAVFKSRVTAGKQAETQTCDLKTNSQAELEISGPCGEDENVTIKKINIPRMNLSAINVEAHCETAEIRFRDLGFNLVTANSGAGEIFSHSTVPEFANTFKAMIERGRQSDERRRQ